MITRSGAAARLGAVLLFLIPLVSWAGGVRHGGGLAAAALLAVVQLGSHLG